MATEGMDVTVRCPNCYSLEHVGAGAKAMACQKCGERFRFLRCPHCNDTTAVAKKHAGLGHQWLCSSCRLPVQNPQWLPARKGTPEELHDRLEILGVLAEDPDVRSFGGFYAIEAQGAYAELKNPVAYALSTLADEVRLVRAGTHETASIPYERLSDVQISGSDETMGRYFHNRLGVAGAVGDIAVGMLAGNTRKKREIRTFMYIESQDGKLLLLHLRLPVDAMRKSFPRLVSRFPHAPGEA
jgi:ribosomal protein L37AE/L43A